MKALEKEIFSLRNISVVNDEQTNKAEVIFEQSEKMSKKKTLEIEQLTKATKKLVMYE